MNKTLFIYLFASVFIAKTFVAQDLDTINLYFEINKYNLTNNHIKALNPLLDRQDAIDIQIYGFTDFLGNLEDNNLLSEQRCNTIKNYLTAQGIDSGRIATWSGKGVHFDSSNENRKDLNDPGIKEHRKVEVIYGKFEKIVDNTIPTEPVEEKNDNETRIPMFNINVDDWIVGETIVLENILFYGGTPNFKPESRKPLEHLLIVMKTNPDLRIEIQGHICCASGDTDGYDHVYKDNNLSYNRARAVYHYLLHNGIDDDRMSYVGFGAKYKKFPKERNIKEEDQNRRVEILILEK